MYTSTTTMADEKVVVFENPARDGKGIPDVYVCYKNLSYTLRLTEKQADRTMNTVPAVLMSAFAAPVKGLASLVGLGPKREDITTEFKVLDKISGVIRPGSMTLLLAPPGAGKTAFLKSLASVPGFTQKLDKSSSVTYNGDSPAELKNKGIYPGQLVQYVDQLDNHMPFLTVRETFEFIGENALAGVDSEGVDARVNDVINLLHLKNAESEYILPKCTLMRIVLTSYHVSVVVNAVVLERVVIREGFVDDTMPTVDVDTSRDRRRSADERILRRIRSCEAG